MIEFPLEQPKTRSLDDESAVDFISEIKGGLIFQLEQHEAPSALIFVLKALPAEAIWSLLQQIWRYIQETALIQQID